MAVRDDNTVVPGPGGAKKGIICTEIDWQQVASLREEGASWADVAKALDLSNQQLWRRRKTAGLL